MHYKCVIIIETHYNYYIITQIVKIFKNFIKECFKLGIAGIVAEFNPFHNGHKYLIDCAKHNGDSVFCVISGNFVQRGDTAVISKFSRARQALLCGADLVAELPCPWSMSTAQNFALGAVSQLNALGINVLYFGSECGDIDKLKRAAKLIVSDDFEKRIKEKVKEGKTFASLRQQTLFEMDSELSSLLDNPNDSLAIEYIIASRKINPEIEFFAVKRVGAQHNDLSSKDKYSTATLIRENIYQNKEKYFRKYMPEGAVRILLESDISQIKNIETAILARLRSLKIDDFKKLPDTSEGIENLIYSSLRTATSLDELYNLIKCKRYTLARIRRLILSAFLGIDNTYFKKEPPYVRVLGFSGNSLSKLPENPIKPIITKVSQINKLSEFSKKVFETECRATDLYSLSLEPKKECGADMTTPIIKV